MAIPGKARPARQGLGPEVAAARRPLPATAWPLAASGAALVVLVFLSYIPALKAGFIWDDDSYVTTNPTLRTPDGLRRIWNEPRALPQYYPLVHTSFWIEYHLWRLDPRGYHVDNVLLHAMSVLLLWRVLARLEVPGAWFAAALLAVHPVEVESVAWVTERKNVLSLALALGSLLFYLRFAALGERSSPPRSTKPPTLAYAAAVALFLAALMSKTVVATLPAVILVLVWWKQRTIRLSDIWPLVPFFALGVGFGLLTMVTEKDHVGATGEEWDFTVADRLLIAGRALWFYAAKLLWPGQLAFFYPRWTIDPAEWWQFLFPASAGAAIFALWLARARIGRGPLAAALIFGGVLVPALGFFDVYPMRFSFVADHFQYHASLALLTLFAAGFAGAAIGGVNRRPFLATTAAALLTVLAVLCWQRAEVFHDLESLYRDTIIKNPQGPTAYANLAVHLGILGRDDEALALARQAVSLGPREALSHNTLGACLLRTASHPTSPPGQLEEGIKELQAALELMPGLADARVNLAMAMMSSGSSADAETQLRTALETNPENPDAHQVLGQLLAAQSDLRGAADQFARAAALRPGFSKALNNLGVVLMNLGEVDRAILSFEEAVQADPGYADAARNLQAARQVRQQASPQEGARWP